MGYLVVAALAFGAFFAIDKGFTRLFRNKKEHKSGLAVKQNKRTAVLGIFLAVLGVAGLLAGPGGGKGLPLLSLVVLAIGAFLVTYYLGFGIYYDEEGFVYSAFGKKSVTYRYSQIRAQKLYLVQGGSMLVELHMEDGTAVNVQSTMEGAYPFLDHAFARWCGQKGIDPDSCEFHDPARGQWFPEVEVS